MDDSFDPMVTASALNEALTSSNNLFAQMTNAMATLPPMDDSFARMINAMAAPPVMDDSFSAMVAEALRPSTEALALTASSLAAEMLRPSADIIASSANALVTEALRRPCADIIASMNSSLAEALRPSVDLFTPMSSTLMTKPVVPYSITLETLQAQIDADKLRRSPAEGAYEALLANIRDFEAKLDDEQEIGITLVSPGQSVTIHIESISYTRPNVITFYGRTDDQEMRKVQLVQHTSQLNVLLLAVDKQRPKARRIGFIQDE